MIDSNKTKPFKISKRSVWNAWLAVKANRGQGGADDIGIGGFEKELSRNLYKIWNRLSSGSYMPPVVKRVEIPKATGGKRPLGIPTVGDRVAQMVAKTALEPEVEKLFHKSSFGFRPKRSAHDAIAQAKENCWKYKWVIDLDIKGFFDNVNHELLMKAVNHVTKNRWIRLYIKRWLQARIITPEGQCLTPTKGTPQGSVISPLLANLFLHYVHDKWMQENFPKISCERYADDIVLHCYTKLQAERVLEVIKTRLKECGLEIHPEKTKLVCCETKCKMNPEYNYAFTFLGFTFQRRGAVHAGERFTGYLPAISKDAKKKIVKEIRRWKMHRWTSATAQSIADEINAKVRGWLNYYGKFYKSEMNFLWEVLNRRLMRWIRNHYKRLNRSKYKSYQMLKQLQQENPTLFAHWKYALENKGVIGGAV